MIKYFTIIAFLILSIPKGFAQQDIKTYEGNWEGTLPSRHSFNFNLTIEDLKTNTFNLTISNNKTSINRILKSTSDDQIQISLDENTRFLLSYNDDATQLSGFVTSGFLMYHISLKKSKKGLYVGTWNPFMIDSLQSQSIYLSVENNDDNSFAIYPFFGDQRFTGTGVGNFEREGDIINFRDYKTGLNFKVTLLPTKIQLEILLSEKTIALTNLSRSDVDLSSINSIIPPIANIKKPVELNDGWPTANLHEFSIKRSPLMRMIDSVNTEALENTHSVLIAKKGKLAFEAYFDGYNVNIPHDQRSASKSISSAMIGIAIGDKLIESTNQSMYDFIPENYQNTKNSQKSKIRIKDLLTMSSGLDAIDFGTKTNSAASENAYQNTRDWLQTVLEAPMIHDHGMHANYGSANPFLLGVCLNQIVKTPLELYMDQTLLGPLGITNYIIQTENTSTMPYFGGGMYLTPRDMLKFGQLYLNQGNWKGKQIISENWVKASFKKHLRLENTNDKNEYGYLWWHKTYTIGERTIASIEARGAGGQYIFVIPELETVVVITSGNYRSNKSQQPEEILEDYILPAIID